MTTVRIPQALRTLTDDQQLVQVSGKNVRQIIDELDLRHPGVKQALVDKGKLRPDIAVMLDGRISQLGLLEPVSDANELLFIPAISGG